MPITHARPSLSELDMDYGLHRDRARTQGFRPLSFINFVRIALVCSGYIVKEHSL